MNNSRNTKDSKDSNKDNKRKLHTNTASRSASEKRLKTFIMPQKAKTLDVVKKLKALKEQTSDIVVAPLPQEEKETEKECYECPACGEKLYAPYPKSLKRLVDRVKQNEIDYQKEQEEEHKKFVEKCRKKSQSFIPPFTFIKSGISKNDQQVICRMHKVELVFKPMGKEKGYPHPIDFEDIPNRMKEFEKELLDIVNRELESEFLIKVLKVHEELGSVKARQAKELINRFDETLPGYYGNRGSHFMMEALNDMFLKTDKINKEMTKPLTPVEFLQQVLVPECGLRLIQQDMKLTTKKEALDVMKESTEYGSIVYNKLKRKKED